MLINLKLPWVNENCTGRFCQWFSLTWDGFDLGHASPNNL